MKDNLGGFSLVQIFAFGFGLTGMAAAIGSFAGAGPNPAHISEWVVLVLFLGAILASTNGLALYAKVQTYEREEWHHPRPLPIDTPSKSRWQSLRTFFHKTKRDD